MGKRHVVLTLILVNLYAYVMADGKMYWRETVPPEIPYQRALILYRDGMETLVLQSKYEIPEKPESASLGWVVPVPAVPEVASMEAHKARQMFMSLAIRSRPNVIDRTNIFFALFLAITATSFLILLIWVFSYFISSSTISRFRQKLIIFAFSSLLLCMIVGIFAPSLSKSLGVDVISEHRVGVYDVRVVKSDNTEELIAWLNINEFKFGEEDQTAFDNYISRGWCFVVANINPTSEQSERQVESEGLAAPLILRFDSDKPVYPVLLTGTGGYDTEILIYLVAETKMTCDDRLTLRFAGEISDDYFAPYLLGAVEPAGFLTAENLLCSYLCKFRDTLTAEQMKEDITFAPASDTTPYRERIVTW